MTHYEVLGVHEHASADQIRDAYRKLVKQYHPDRNSSQQAAELIKQINEAYDVLSDSHKRSAYDRRYQKYFEPVVEPDPNEVYRREYQRKRREKEQERRKEEERFEELKDRFKKQIFRVARWLTFPIAAFALIAVIDPLLPQTVSQETADYGWQVRSGGRRGAFKSYHSFMRTKSFQFAAPNDVHIDYDYAVNPEPLNIYVTPILRRISKVELLRENKMFSWNPRSTFLMGLEYLMLLASILALLVKQFSDRNYYIRLAPVGTAGLLALVSLM